MKTTCMRNHVCAERNVCRNNCNKNLDHYEYYALCFNMHKMIVMRHYQVMKQCFDIMRAAHSPLSTKHYHIWKKVNMSSLYMVRNLQAMEEIMIRLGVFCGILFKKSRIMQNIKWHFKQWMEKYWERHLKSQFVYIINGIEHAPRVLLRSNRFRKNVKRIKQSSFMISCLWANLVSAW